MPMMLNQHRTEALWRLLGLAYFVTIGWVVLLVAGVAGVIWMAIDVTVQLLFGKEAMPQPGNMGTRFLKRLWEWGNGQMEYVLFGEGSFPIFP